MDAERGGERGGRGMLVVRGADGRRGLALRGTKRGRLLMRWELRYRECEHYAYVGSSDLRR